MDQSWHKHRIQKDDPGMTNDTPPDTKTGRRDWYGTGYGMCFRQKEKIREKVVGLARHFGERHISEGDFDKWNTSLFIVQKALF